MSSHQEAFLDKIPQGWTFDRLKDVVALRNEKTDEVSADKDYLELEDLESGTGRIINRRNTLEVESAVTRFKKGDVLFGKLRPYLEKVYVAEFDGKCTGEILALKPERLESQFLFYCIASRWFIERCNALAYGAKMPRVSWEKQLSQFDLPQPPLKEQRCIAAYLDASCLAIDAAVAAKRQQLETLNATWEGILESAVTKGIRKKTTTYTISRDWIDVLPATWQAVRIKRVVSRVDYGISVSSEQEGRYPVLKMGNIQAGEIVFSKIEFVDDVAAELILETNDLLYNRTNSPDQVGKAAIYRGTKKDGVTFASYLVRLRPNHRVLPNFLAHVLNCRGFLEFARKLAIPSVQQSNLNSTRYGQLHAPLPPLSEQQEIVEWLDNKREAIARVASTIEKQIEILVGYRKSLIHECVTGQHRITDKDVDRMRMYV